MTFPFKWIREERWRTEPGQVVALEMNQRCVLPAVSVQPDWNNSQGIIRGVKEAGFLVEDHIREEIQGGRPVDVGRRIAGPDEMRRDVWTVDKHKSEFIKHHPEEKIVAWVGNGNLLSNPHFVGFVDGQIYGLSSEEKQFQSRSYSSIIVKKINAPNRVTIQPISYKFSSKGTQILSSDGKDISKDVECATFGQHIVRDGQPIDVAQYKEMVLGGQFYDLRHVFLFGRIPMGEKHWLDAGLSAFWDEEARLDTDNLKTALDGQPVVIDVRSQFDEAEVRIAMDAKGYDEVPEPNTAGHYSLQNGELRVSLLEGLYPHNIIGIKEDGTILSVVLRGLSNRVGVTIRGAAEIMVSLGAKDALLLDNGGDVMMSFCEDQVLGSAEGERNRLRSVLLFRLVSDHTDVKPQDFRLVTYPKQFVAS